MPALATEGWQELATSSKHVCPKLFYNFSVANGGFSLSLTDLIGLWQCSLDKDDVIAEAANQQTSIDPSESTDQLNVLLSKLRQSLEERKSRIIRHVEDVDSSPSLALKTVLGLPKPLKPLNWTFPLEPTPVSELSEAILRPALHQLSVCQQKIDSLQRLLKDKDHVISKLLDRKMASAVDMSSIFPTLTGIAGRRGTVTVDDAKKHVPGMAAFDLESWHRSFRDENSEEEDKSRGLGKLVSGCEKCFVHSREEHEGWITRLPDSRSRDEGASQKSRPSQSQRLTSQNHGQTPVESEDDFETAVTPPSIRNKAASTAPQSKDEDSTATEDDSLDLPAKQTRTRKLGRIGKRRQKTASASPTPGSNADGKGQSPRLGTQTMSRKLGRLGARNQTKEQNELPAETSPPSARTRNQTSPEQARQSAVDVDMREDSDATASMSSRSPSPALAAAPANLKDEEPPASPDLASEPKPESTTNGKPSSTSHAPPPPETEEEAATRRREELKRTIQSGGGPKKKRRF